MMNRVHGELLGIDALEAMLSFSELKHTYTILVLKKWTSLDDPRGTRNSLNYSGSVREDIKTLT